MTENQEKPGTVDGETGSKARDEHRSMDQECCGSGEMDGERGSVENGDSNGGEGRDGGERSFSDDSFPELLPDEKKYSLVQLDYFKPPWHDEAAFKKMEFDDIEEVNQFTEVPHMYGFLVKDRDGNDIPLPETMRYSNGVEGKKNEN
ncbi:MAG: hypothetical protein ABEK59_07000 [Halobacteria archaeon]